MKIEKKNRDHSRLLVFIQTTLSGDACSDPQTVKSPPMFFHQLSPEVGSTTHP